MSDPEEADEPFVPKPMPVLARIAWVVTALMVLVFLVAVVVMTWMLI